MKIDNLDKMIGGWFIGNFEPSLLKTNDCEVAVKRYNKGEYTVIINGRIKMNGIEYGTGSIITMEPNEVTDFECLEDGTVNVVVKIPGANNDKYVVE